MLEAIKEDEYRTLQNFCQRYRFALLRLSEDFCIRESNATAERLFNVQSHRLQGKSLITLCEQTGQDCPIVRHANNTPEAQTTYHHALQIKCRWHVIEVQRQCQPSAWLLLGKMLKPSSPSPHLNLSSQFLDRIPTPIYCKNTQGIYVQCNQAARQLANQNIIGKTDFNLPWRDQAESFQSSDQLALQGQTITCLQTMTDYMGKTRQFRTTKQPIYGPDQHIISILAVSLECTPEEDSRHTQAPEKPLGGIAFTTQELEYINWMAKGKTADEIAMILNKSQRTVETHLNKTRRKTACQNQFQMGYLLAQHLSDH